MKNNRMMSLLWDPVLVVAEHPCFLLKIKEMREPKNVMRVINLCMNWFKRTFKWFAPYHRGIPKAASVWEL